MSKSKVLSQRHWRIYFLKSTTFFKGRYCAFWDNTATIYISKAYMNGRYHGGVASALGTWDKKEVDNWY